MRAYLLVLIMLAAVILCYVIDEKSSTAYEGTMQSGLSAGYITNYYRKRGSSFLIHVYGVDNEENIVNSSGIVVDSHRASITVYMDGMIYNIYSDEQKVKDYSYLKGIEPIYLYLKSHKEMDRVYVRVNPLSGSSDLLLSLCNKIRNKLSEKKIPVKVLLMDAYMFNDRLMHDVKNNDFPVEYLLNYANSLHEGNLLLVISPTSPYYLSYEDALPSLIHDVGRFLKEGGYTNFFFSNIEIKIILDRKLSGPEISKVISEISKIPEVSYVKVLSEFPQG